MKEKDASKVITKITWKKDKANVYFSNRKIELSQNAFTEFRLFVGKELTSSEIKKMTSFSKLDMDYEYALRLVSHKNYSEMELRNKLISRKASLENRNKIVGLLKKAGFINDKEYAREYLEEALELKGYGSRRIIYELGKKGINEDILTDLKVPYKKERETAEKVLAMLIKRYQRETTNKKKEKIARALYERGFSEELIAELSSKIPAGDSKTEKASLRKELQKAIKKFEAKYRDYDLKEHVIASLIQKGYSYGDIKDALEEEYL